MIARQASADVIVVALVGERGREVREFTEEILGERGMDRSVVVIATSDESSIVRQTAPFTATAIAEYFRDQGKNVLLIVDSLTRMARALRETSLTAGEIPVRHGYTNSVYIQLPKLLERAGTSSIGSITAIYTILTNEEEDIDPLADEIKSLLDGHLVLRRALAARGVFPAIDVTASISRLFTRLNGRNHIERARHVRAAITRLYGERDIMLIGGTPDAELQKILSLEGELMAFHRQELSDAVPFDETIRRLSELSDLLR
jgi:FliI/YscN family ATPase